MNTFEQLFKIADKHLTNFRNDLLIHDKKAVEKDPSAKFLHLTRATGTAFVRLDDIDLKQYNPGTTIEQVLKGKEEYLKYYLFTSSLKVCAYFDGEKVRKTTVKKAWERWVHYKITQMRKAKFKQEQEREQENAIYK